MLETAKKEGYAYPAVNVTTIEVINGALRAFSEAKSDGIIQVSIGGGKFASGSSVGNSALGAIVLAEATRRLAEKHNVLVALHTDHCQPEHVDTFLRPLIAESRRRVERGEAPPLQFPHAGCLHASHGGKPQAFPGTAEGMRRTGHRS